MQANKIKTKKFIKILRNNNTLDELQLLSQRPYILTWMTLPKFEVCSLQSDLNAQHTRTEVLQSPVAWRNKEYVNCSWNEHMQWCESFQTHSVTKIVTIFVLWNQENIYTDYFFRLEEVWLKFGLLLSSF